MKIRLTWSHPGTKAEQATALWEALVLIKSRAIPGTTLAHLGTRAFCLVEHRDGTFSATLSIADQATFLADQLMMYLERVHDATLHTTTTSEG